jgi:hypothetical protein
MQQQMKVKGLESEEGWIEGNGMGREGGRWSGWVGEGWGGIEG